MSKDVFLFAEGGLFLRIFIILLYKYINDIYESVMCDNIYESV